MLQKQVSGMNGRYGIREFCNPRGGVVVDHPGGLSRRESDEPFGDAIKRENVDGQSCEEVVLDSATLTAMM